MPAGICGFYAPGGSYVKTMLMDASKILSADPLDILFDGRNKAYGAYDLRKHYRERLRKALLIMFSSLLLIFGGIFLFGFINPGKGRLMIDNEVLLAKVEPPPAEKKIEPPPVIPPPQKEEVRMKMKQFTPPVIEKDPPEDEKPPEMKELDDVKIGTANNPDGKLDDGTITAPVGDSKGLVDVAKKPVEDDAPFIKVEKESEDPGGPEAWKRYLERNLFNNYPQEAMDNEVQGSVMIQFVVDVNGVVSDVTALAGPKELQSAAITVIRKSGKWTPAIQNGRKVKSYKKQQITFRLGE